MPTAYASSKSSKDGDDKPSVDTMTSGDGASAAASSKNSKDGGGIFFQTSKSTRDKDGTHTEKTWGRRGTDEKDSKPKSTESEKKDSAAQKDGKTDDGGQGVFAKAGSAFAAATGGAVASAGGGKAVASTE